MKNPLPTSWLTKLLTRLLESRSLEASLGDLEEKYARRIGKGTPAWKAKALYIIEGLGFVKMANLKKSRQAGEVSQAGYALFFFLRLVRRDKSYYFVSLLGLTVSLTSFLLMMMFVYDELSFDRFHTNADRIYRISTRLNLNEVEYDMATTQFPLAGVIANDAPAVEQVVRIYRTDQLIVSGDNAFEETVLYADDSFHDVFSFPFLHGNAKTATGHDAGIVLSEQAAKKYFGDINPIGKTLIANEKSLEVTGVLKRIPDQSHFHFDALIPLNVKLQEWKSQTGLEGRENKWFWVGAHTYVMIREQNTVAELEESLREIVATHFPERYRTGGTYEVQNIKDIHLRSNRDAELAKTGSILYVGLFAVVAFVIMIISSINLVNLSWFKVNNRIREVGIRKFLGQNASSIIRQFSIESLLIGLAAFILSLAVCIAVISYFNNLVHKDLDLSTSANMTIIGGALLMVLAICMLSVTKPAIRYATAASSKLLLKNQSDVHNTNKVRNTMVGIQVALSFVLLVFSLLISDQIEFFRQKGLGFDKQDILVVKLDGPVNSHFDAFRDELQNNTSIRSVAGAESPGQAIPGWRFVPEGGSYEKPVMLPFTSTFDGFIETLGIKLLAGHDFPTEVQTDSLPTFLINKQAAIELGWPEDPIGRTMEVFAPGTTEIMMKGRVVGLMDNYHYESLHNPVKPLVICLGSYFSEALVKFNKPIDEQSIAAVQAAYKKITDRPMEYEILEDKLDRLYINEFQLSHVILFFTFIALYLTCYGLFAMSSLLFSSKLREVAIRKVFGANQLDIIRQFYTRYALFNLVAIVVGIPVAVYVSNAWLTNFQYRVSLDSLLFVKAAVAILLAGMLSVSYYLTRVAKSNPVKFLRGD
jgi:putative ABC transport system permease protein